MTNYSLLSRVVNKHRSACVNSALASTGKNNKTIERGVVGVGGGTGEERERGVGQGVGGRIISLLDSR